MILEDLRINIENILGNLKPNKLSAYKLTQNRLHEVNVANDIIYRRTYTGFYVLRLPKSEAYNLYFTLIEKHKNNNAISLNYILKELKYVTGRIETSFGSKLLATINPNVAPLDKIVLGNLGLSLPSYNAHDRMQECVKTHKALVEKMNHLITLPEFIPLKTKFEQRFPDYTFTDTKILDLLLWQYRTP
ncbi:hypothetical protein [Endothiovibrio diazotrophicus]